MTDNLYQLDDVGIDPNKYPTNSPERELAFLNWTKYRISNGETCCHYHKDFSMHNDPNSWGFHPYAGRTGYKERVASAIAAAQGVHLSRVPRDSKVWHDALAMAEAAIRVMQ